MSSLHFIEKTKPVTVPGGIFFVSRVKNAFHELVKLKFNEQVKYNPFCDETQSLYDTDFFDNASTSKMKMLYDIIVTPIALQHLNNIANILYSDLKSTPMILNSRMWFQSYSKNDTHPWHTHTDCMFSSVYYINKPASSPNTSFKYMNSDVFSVDVSEGDILTFPSLYPHCSKPYSKPYSNDLCANSPQNLATEATSLKSIIAFNTNFELLDPREIILNKKSWYETVCDIHH